MPHAPAADGVRLHVRVTPRSRADRIGPVAVDGRTARLRLAVTAPPHEGRANAAVIALLARALRLPKSAFAIAAGDGAREKTIAIRGDVEAISARLASALAEAQPPEAGR